MLALAALVAVAAAAIYLSGLFDGVPDQHGGHAVGSIEPVPIVPGADIPSPEAPTATSGPVAWTAVAVDTIDPRRIPAHGKTGEDAVLVALAADIRTLGAGDRITLTVPQTGGSWTTTIADVEGAGSNRSYIGRLESGPFPASFVVTVGERHTFAHLSTSLGSYQLTGNTEFAWLARAKNVLYGDDVDYSVSRWPDRGNDDG